MEASNAKVKDDMLEDEDEKLWKPFPSKPDQKQVPHFTHPGLLSRPLRLQEVPSQSLARVTIFHGERLLHLQVFCTCRCSLPLYRRPYGYYDNIILTLSTISASRTE